MRSLPRFDRYVETTGGIRDVGEKGEIGALQGLSCVRFGEQDVSLLPVAACGGLTSPFQEDFVHRSLHWPCALTEARYRPDGM